MINQSGSVVIKWIIATVFFAAGIFIYSIVTDFKEKEQNIATFDYSESENGIGETHIMKLVS